MPRHMPERDEEGRFVSDSDHRNRSGGYSRGRGGYDRDDDDRRYSRGRSRGRYDDDDYSRGRGHGGWFGDSEGHSEASELGWERRRREGDYGGRSRGRSSRYDDDDRRYSRSRYDDDRRYSRGRYDDDDYSRDRGQGGWFGDSEGHSEASELGWERRRREGDYGGRSRGRSSRYDDDDRRYSRSRYDDDDYSRDRGQGGWFGDSEGHSEASELGWERRRREGDYGGRSRGRR
ncbi:hypothetical protein [Pontibaca methylaminivorans]|uniref:Uncharacterized protein n=1 Tax=Pontibaca methylaminivorans TaxID=515897 RepID=A0A1R3XB05_9RHOB|nr:hypothetical protein [Pontibaca methylaminivorans]SIT86709.1 hypothetical protein SAMN05421849_2382 [Pontibaca methylaminivorans]